MTKAATQTEFIRYSELHQELEGFDEFDTRTRCEFLSFGSQELPVFVNEFWTSKQRAGHPLHEVSYRACFKPQLPKFFIERLTEADDLVYDPFMGRGTTLLEGALLGRKVVGCDINPLSERLIRPRLELPDLEEIEARMGGIDLGSAVESVPEDLFAFYHPETLRQLVVLREYFQARQASGKLDSADWWIRMVATNRLTGHSSGFFSVYTMPPNQAVSVQSQLRINERRKQTPPVRDVKAIILKKTRSLLRGISDGDRELLKQASRSARYFTQSCVDTPQIADSSVKLVVTSPPFLDIVDYQGDNWLRGWFNNIDTSDVPIWQLKREEDWVAAMRSVFHELHRVLADDGHIAFEVGEVRNAKIKMEALVLNAAKDMGLSPELILINDQEFTKTANCWGVSNGSKGTNTNRIVLLSKL